MQAAWMRFIGTLPFLTGGNVAQCENIVWITYTLHFYFREKPLKTQRRF